MLLYPTYNNFILSKSNNGKFVVLRCVCMCVRIERKCQVKKLKESQFNGIYSSFIIAN